MFLCSLVLLLVAKARLPPPFTCQAQSLFFLPCRRLGYLNLSTMALQQLSCHITNTSGYLDLLYPLLVILYPL